MKFNFLELALELMMMKGFVIRDCPYSTKTQEVMYPYTAERRDVLENTLPEAQEISQGRGFCTPRPERLPEGEARGQSRGPRGAKSPPEGNLEGRGGVFSNASRLEAVYGHSFSISREVLILWCDNRWH